MIRSLLVAAVVCAVSASVARAQVPSIVVSPSPIVFGCTLSGEDSVRYITVLNTGTAPITIHGYRAPAPFLAPATRDVELEPGESTLDSVRFQPVVAPGNPSVVLVVETSGGELEVPMSGEIGLEPGISASMTRIPYESVTVGTTKDTCIIIRNQSCRPLRIDSIVVENGVFVITKGFPTPYILGAFAEEEFCISFTPNAPADFVGRLLFFGDLGKRLIVPLDGRGVRAEIIAELTDINFGTIDLGSTSADTIVYITNLGTEFATIEAGMTVTGVNPGDFILTTPTLPMPIGPTERIPLRVRFQPTATGQRTARIVVNNTSGADPVITLRGVGSTFDVVALPDTIDMGAVRLGSSRLAVDTLIVRNRSSRTVTILNTTMSGSDASSFGVLGFLTVPVAAGTDYSLDVVFTPRALGRLEAEVVGTLDNGTSFRVVLLGVGLDTSAPRPRRVIGDSIHMRVGERRVMRFTIERPFTESDSVFRIIVRLRVDPRALYPHRISTTGTATTSRSYAANGTIDLTISSQVAMAIDGFDLELEGLFTGRPRNDVMIESVDVGNPQIGVTTSPGLATLEGCDIRDTSTLARSVRIVDILPNPSSGGEAIVRFISSAPAQARVVGVDGREVRRVEIPASDHGTPGMLAVTGLSPGVYVLEIVSGAVRDHSILIVNQ